MGIKPKTVRIKTRIEDHEYIICTLSINIKNEEFFYLIDWPDDINSQLNLNTQQRITSISKISFHKEHILIKTKTLPDKKEQAIGKIDNILLSTNNEVKLLLVESFIKPTSILVQSTKWKAEHERIISIIPQETHFSLIILLAQKTITTENLFLYSYLLFNKNEIPLINFKKANHTIGRIEIFENFDLIIFTTPYVAPIINEPIELIPSGRRIINYQSPQSFLAKIVEQL